QHVRNESAYPPTAAHWAHRMNGRDVPEAELRPDTVPTQFKALLELAGSRAYPHGVWWPPVRCPRRRDCIPTHFGDTANVPDGIAAPSGGFAHSRNRRR